MNRRVRTPAALLLLALIGLAAAFWLAPGRTVPPETSREVRFVREMTQHHLQAVDMATRVRDRTDDPAVRSLALDILLSQQGQVGEMRGWLTQWGRAWGGVGMTAEHARAMGMASDADLRALSAAKGANAEREFLRLMIRHHQGAVSMVDGALKSRLRPEVRLFASNIAAAQQAEIALMRDMLKARDAAPLPAPSGEGAGGMDGMPGMDHDH